MTTKEKVITESIERAQREFDNINYLLNADPFYEILKIMQEAKALTGKEEDCMSKLKELKKRKEAQERIIDKLKDRFSLMEKKVSLSMEIDSLKRELYFLNKFG